MPDPETQEARNDDRAARIALAALLLLAFATRLPFLNPYMTGSEAYDYLASAQRIAAGGWREFQPSKPPLLIWLIAVLMKVAGPTNFLAAKLPVFVAGVAIPPLVFALVRRMAGGVVFAALAAVAALASPVLLVHAGTFNYKILCSAFVLASALALLRFEEKRTAAAFAPPFALAALALYSYSVAAPWMALVLLHGALRLRLRALPYLLLAAAMAWASGGYLLNTGGGLGASASPVEIARTVLGHWEVYARWCFPWDEWMDAGGAPYRLALGLEAAGLAAAGLASLRRHPALVLFLGTCAAAYGLYPGPTATYMTIALPLALCAIYTALAVAERLLPAARSLAAVLAALFVVSGAPKAWSQRVASPADVIEKSEEVDVFYLMDLPRVIDALGAAAPEGGRVRLTNYLDAYSVFLGQRFRLAYPPDRFGEDFLALAEPERRRLYAEMLFEDADFLLLDAFGFAPHNPVGVTPEILDEATAWIASGAFAPEWTVSLVAKIEGSRAEPAERTRAFWDKHTYLYRVSPGPSTR